MTEPPSLRTYERVVLFLVSAFSYACVGFVGALEKADLEVTGGRVPYRKTAVVLVAETAKLTWTVIRKKRDNPKADLLAELIGGSTNGKGASDNDKGTFLKYIGYATVPAVLYALVNNMVQVIAKYVDAASWSALLQNRILVTAVVWKLVFPEKVIDRVQIVALVILTLGSMAVAWDATDVTELMVHSNSKDAVVGPRKTYVTTLGLVMVAIYISCSAIAGVYVEYFYKRVKGTVFQQDIANYSMGLFVAYVVYVWDCAGSDRSHLGWGGSVVECVTSNPFQGFSKFAWGTAGGLIFTGVATSRIMLYFTNIHKLLIQSFSTYLSAGLMFAFLELQFPPRFVAGLFTITCAVLLYNHKSVFPGLYNAPATNGGNGASAKQDDKKKA